MIWLEHSSRCRVQLPASGPQKVKALGGRLSWRVLAENGAIENWPQVIGNQWINRNNATKTLEDFC